MSRYIDAEELKRVKFHPLPYTHITPSDVDAESYKRGWNDAIDAIVDCQPTADVRENVQLDVCPLYGGACGYPSGECYDCPRHGNFRENVRGEWIKKKGSLWTLATCSVCGELSVDGDKPFCPNCGAEMRPISALSENVEIVSNLKRGES